MTIKNTITNRLLALAATFESSVAGLFGAAALMAFIGQPYLPFLPAWTIVFGIMTGISIVLLTTAAARKKPHHVIAQGVSGFIAICGLLIAFAQASDVRHKNDRRCYAIQQDMLSSMPLRSDGPDLFQALGCRPQGDGNVYAERDAKNDPGAEIEQNIRRRALTYRKP